MAMSAAGIPVSGDMCSCPWTDILPLGMCPLGPGLQVSCSFAQNGQMLETSMCQSFSKNTKEGGCMVTILIYRVQPRQMGAPGVSVLQGTSLPRQDH